MLSRRTFTASSIAWSVSGCDLGAGIDRVRQEFASPDSKLEAAAAKEGALFIEATTDQQGLEDLLESFGRLYPHIALGHRRPPSLELSVNFMRDANAGRPTADILISSAMDLQFKLVNDGFALTYLSPHKPQLPAWASWKDQAYAVTAEPIIFAYNRALVPPGDVPRSHEELAELLRRKPDYYRGRIATYDPERSGTGYLYYTQDLLLSHDTQGLAEALGRTQPKFYVSGAEANDKLVSGEIVLAYNMVSSYILEKQSRNPNLGIVFPSDYTLVMSRIAIIPKVARHPAAAKLFLDFLLSQAGQARLASRFMRPIRMGVPMEGAAPPAEVLRPIHFGPSLLANLDEFRRRRVLREWRHSLES